MRNLNNKKKFIILASIVTLIILMVIIANISNSPEIPKDEYTTIYHDNRPISVTQSLKKIEDNLNNPSQTKKAKSIQEFEKEMQLELQEISLNYNQLAEKITNQTNNTKQIESKTHIPIVQNTPTTQKTITSIDRQAFQSAVFFPNGAPIPNKETSNSSQSSNNKTSSQSSDGNAGENEDSTNKIDDSSSFNDTSSSYGNNGNGVYYYDNSDDDMELQYTPSGEYDFIYNATTVGENPLDNISEEVTLTITITNPSDSYTGISFCNMQFASCLDELELSSSSLTIDTDNVDQIKPTITDNNYISTSITIDDTASNYMVPKLYFLLSISDSTTLTQASASFPTTSSCTADSENETATCTVTNSSSVTMTITVNGSTESSS